MKDDMSPMELNITVDPKDYPEGTEEELYKLMDYIFKAEPEIASLSEALCKKTTEIQDACDCPENKREEKSTKTHSGLERCSLCKKLLPQIILEKIKKEASDGK